MPVWKPLSGHYFQIVRHLLDVNLGELWVLHQNILTIVEEIRVFDRLGSVADAAQSDRFEPLALRSAQVRVCALLVNVRQLLNELGNVWAE